MIETKDWVDYVSWKDIRNNLGDWKWKIKICIVFCIKITININWIRDLVAQTVAFFLNLLLNVFLFLAGVIAVLIVALISLIVQVFAPVLKPLFQAWSKLQRQDLGIDIYSEGTVYRGLSNLLWGSLPGWAFNMIGNMWKPVEKIYAEIPEALAALESIRAYLASTVFVVVLEHLGVGGPIISAVRSVIEFVQKWVDKLERWLESVQEWVKNKLGIFWWVVEEYVTGVFVQLYDALDELRRLFIDPIVEALDEIEAIAGLWIDKDTHIKPGFFKFVLGRAFTTVVNSIARAYGVLDSLTNFLMAYKEMQDIEKKRVDDNEDTIAVMFETTLTSEELAKMQAAPVMRDIDRTTVLIEKYITGEKVAQGSDIDKTEEEISGFVG